MIVERKRKMLHACCHAWWRVSVGPESGRYVVFWKTLIIVTIIPIGVTGAQGSISSTPNQTA
jgi:hypothetical protein